MPFQFDTGLDCPDQCADFPLWALCACQSTSGHVDFGLFLGWRDLVSENREVWLQGESWVF